MNVAEQKIISSYFETLQGRSSTARSMLDIAIAGNGLQVGKALGYAAFARAAETPYMGFNLDLMAGVHSFNTKGTFQLELPELIVAHELAHYVFGYKDPLDDVNLHNSANFDFAGPTVEKTNQIATEMGLTDNLRASCHATLNAADYRFSLFEVGKNYTEITR